MVHLERRGDYVSVTDPALTDPCKDHTVLDDTWRSADCKEKEYSDKGMCDQQLDEGWYWFKSSGGWKIPETPVAPGHCSTHRSGWLQGSHPTLEQGEVNGTVCFNWDGNPCSWEREIKIKNCSSYFVYELKPTQGCEAAYCTDPNSALTEPCVDHTVLNQPWRSSDCTETECVGQRQCDKDLVYGWYRFNSSGGWKIPETPVAPGHCSTPRPGWLQGSHPTLEQGEVNRTVCFLKDEEMCEWKREIKIKNCSSYFVYELKPTQGCEAAYCTGTLLFQNDPGGQHWIYRDTDTPSD
ncbi:uromodulin-like [Mustelus asterias]